MRSDTEPDPLDTRAVGLDASVVIPTHDRREALLRALEALAGQTLAAGRFEVIVALDSVSDGSAAALAGRNWPFALRTVVSTARNPAATRNLGASLARGRRIVFLDDDIAVGPGFLAAHLAAGGEDPMRIVVGRSTPDLTGTGWFYEGLAGWWEGRFRDLAQPWHRPAHTDLMSGNVSIPRPLFEALGGFEPSLALREDYELGYRALAAGADLVFCAEAEGLHRDATDPDRNLRRVRAEGAADVAFARLHPGSFRALPLAGLAAPTRSSALLRLVAFRAPGLMPRLVAAARALRPMAERRGWRRAWDALGHVAWGFSYYAGVAEAAGSAADLLDLRDAAPALAPRELAVDLCDGPEAAVARVEAERPDQLAIHAGARRLGTLGAWPGLARLRGRDLQVWLEGRRELWAPHVAAARRLPPLPAADLPPIPAAGWSVGELDLADWSLRAVRQPLSLPLVTLVRDGPEPLGWVWLEADTARDGTLPGLRRVVLASRAICEAVLRTRGAPVAPAAPESDRALPPISVVVCTRDRTDNLEECLDALARLDYPAHEIIVVDNAPRTDATARLVERYPGVRRVVEERPGLDWARNRGLAEARHALVAYTDDDTRADPLWLRGVAEGFDDPRVAAVTGLVAPMELATPAQRYFEMTYGGMGKGFGRRTWSLAEVGRAGILWASACGVGANMAVRRDAARAAGLFDPALDVGTATRGGGDIEMLHRLMAGGHEVQYVPRAMVWHRHRADWAGLGRQLADNGSGFAGYLAAAWRRRTVPRALILRFVARDWVWGWLVRRMLRPGPHRRDLVLREIGGMLRGPGLARRARAEAAALGAPAPDPAPRAP